MRANRGEHLARMGCSPPVFPLEALIEQRSLNTRPAVTDET